MKRIFETVTNEPFSKRTNIRIFVRIDDVSIIKPNQGIFGENDEKSKDLR